MQSLVPHSRRADITFNKNGIIDISSHVVKTLNIQDDDILDFCNDKRELYLTVKYKAADVVGRHLNRVFRSNKRGNHYRLYSSFITRYIFQITKSQSSKLSLNCGAITVINERVYLPIILPLNTNTNQNHDKRD